MSSTPRNPRIPIELTEFIRALIPAAGHERSGTAIKIGTAFSLVTSKSQQDEIVRTIAEQAPEARRVLKVNRAASGLIPIEKEVIHRFGSSLYPAPPKPGRLFRKEEAEWVYYDSEALRQNPVVGPLLQRTLTRIDGKSFAMRSVNAAYGAVIAFRRWRKGLSP